MKLTAIEISSKCTATSATGRCGMPFSRNSYTHLAPSSDHPVSIVSLDTRSLFVGFETMQSPAQQPRLHERLCTHCNAILRTLLDNQAENNQSRREKIEDLGPSLDKSGRRVNIDAKKGCCICSSILLVAEARHLKPRIAKGYIISKTYISSQDQTALLFHVHTGPDRSGDSPLITSIDVLRKKVPGSLWLDESGSISTQHSGPTLRHHRRPAPRDFPILRRLDWLDQRATQLVFTEPQCMQAQDELTDVVPNSIDSDWRRYRRNQTSFARLHG